MATFLFNLFALFTVIAAVGVVLNKNAVNAAMCLLLSLVGVAGLFIALHAYLLAFLLLLERYGPRGAAAMGVLSRFGYNQRRIRGTNVPMPRDHGEESSPARPLPHHD